LFTQPEDEAVENVQWVGGREGREKESVGSEEKSCGRYGEGWPRASAYRELSADKDIVGIMYQSNTDPLRSTAMPAKSVDLHNAMSEIFLDR